MRLNSLQHTNIHSCRQDKGIMSVPWPASKANETPELSLSPAKCLADNLQPDTAEICCAKHDHRAPLATKTNPLTKPSQTHYRWQLTIAWKSHIMQICSEMPDA